MNLFFQGSQRKVVGKTSRSMKSLKKSVGVRKSQLRGRDGGDGRGDGRRDGREDGRGDGREDGRGNGQREKSGYFGEETKESWAEDRLDAADRRSDMLDAVDKRSNLLDATDRASNVLDASRNIKYDPTPSISFQIVDEAKQQDSTGSIPKGFEWQLRDSDCWFVGLFELKT